MSRTFISLLARSSVSMANIACEPGRKLFRTGTDGGLLTSMLTVIVILFAVSRTEKILDISPELRTALIEEYANERKPSDGEIYRKISQYKQEHNAHFQNRWWARLSSNKARRLKQLHKNTKINCAFDALLPIPGLWAGMSIGKLAKVMALDSDEVV
jgi:hypothetical protein